MTKPSDMRTSEIKSIVQSGEDEATVELENGILIELQIEDIVKDWLILHRKAQVERAR